MPFVAGRPTVLTVGAGAVDRDPRVLELVERTRASADVFVFLCGGAAKMSPPGEQRLLGLFDAFALLTTEGVRLAVGDGGTQAGLMEAAGLARRAGGFTFPLIGVAPAPEIPPRGQTPIDPNHSDIVAVENNVWDGSSGWWGSETETMYALFARLSENRPSAALVANGGAVTLTEVDQNIRAGRPIVLIAGSGRAADAVASLLTGTVSDAGEVAELRTQAAAARLARRPDLFRIVNLNEMSARSLANVLREALETT